MFWHIYFVYLNPFFLEPFSIQSYSLVVELDTQNLFVDLFVVFGAWLACWFFFSFFSPMSQQNSVCFNPFSESFTIQGYTILSFDVFYLFCELSIKSNVRIKCSQQFLQYLNSVHILSIKVFSNVCFFKLWNISKFHRLNWKYEYVNTTATYMKLIN